MKRNIVLALAAVALAAPLAAPLAAQAQDVPSYAADGNQNYSGDEQIRGRILSFDGAYALAVRDDRGFVDNVQLHQGTIINPTGLTLEPGMVVSILGYNSGSYLGANEIDTPYTYFDGGIPYYSGHPWNYYGPTIGLSFFFGGGGGGWWHGDRGYAFQRYGYSGGGGRNVYIDNTYRSNVSYHNNGYGGNYQHGGGYGQSRGGGFNGSRGGVPPQNGGGGYYAPHGGGGYGSQQNGQGASVRRYPQNMQRGGGEQRGGGAQHGGGERRGGDQRAH